MLGVAARLRGTLGMMNTAEIPPELCDACRFESLDYTNDNVLGTLRALTPWWRLIVANVADDSFHARPSAAVWSGLEYLEHSTEVTNLLALGLEAMHAQPLVALQAQLVVPPVAKHASTRPSDAVLDEFDGATAAFIKLATATSATQRHHRLTFPDGIEINPDWIVRHAVHDAVHHLYDVATGLRGLGAGVAPHSGTVVQINLSSGGVPKRAVAEAKIERRGLVGDRQATRVHHGRVIQAVCLASFEAIERMQAEGHPIFAGAAGENFTLAGVDWAALRPGVRMRIGDAVLETTLPAVPCAQNAQWFADRKFNRIHHAEHPSETRWYARVVHDGSVRAGDPVRIDG